MLIIKKTIPALMADLFPNEVNFGELSIILASIIGASAL